MKAILKINSDYSTSIISELIPNDVTGISYSPKEQAVTFFKVSTGSIGFIYNDGKVVTVPQRMEVAHPIAMCCDKWGTVLMQSSPEMLWCFNQSLNSGERMCGRRAFEDTKNILPEDPKFAEQCAICRLGQKTVIFTAPWANKVVEIREGLRRDYAGSGKRGFISSSNPLVSMFNFPSGICFDIVTGTLFISDTGNSVVRAFKNRKEIGFVGTPGKDGQSDGQGTSARFNQPTSLCSADGIVSVADDKTVSQFNTKTLLSHVVYSSDKRIVGLTSGEKCIYVLETDDADK